MSGHMMCMIFMSLSILIFKTKPPSDSWVGRWGGVVCDETSQDGLINDFGSTGYYWKQDAEAARELLYSFKEGGGRKDNG